MTETKPLTVGPFTEKLPTPALRRVSINCFISLSLSLKKKKEKALFLRTVLGLQSSCSDTQRAPGAPSGDVFAGVVRVLHSMNQVSQVIMN